MNSREIFAFTFGSMHNLKSYSMGLMPRRPRKVPGIAIRLPLSMATDGPGLITAFNNMWKWIELG